MDSASAAVPLKLRANIRSEPSGATTCYVWGKPAERSSILRGLNGRTWINDAERHPLCQRLGIGPGDIVAERWIVSDDATHPSRAELPDGRLISLRALLSQSPEALLGTRHLAKFGPFLCTVMKLLDTHDDPARGGLSVQVHPPEGYVGRPPKPEMWKGSGRIYLGWRRAMDEASVRSAVRSKDIERHLNEISLVGNELVLVEGGVVHAIRSGTFTAEWSMAPGRVDADGNNDLARATATLFDGTDGRPPRPGKEDLESSLDILRAANGFAATTKVTTEAVVQFDAGDGNRQLTLFLTPQVHVEQWEIATRLEVPSNGRGFGVYVETGNLDIVSPGGIVSCNEADECFVPASTGALTLVARGGPVVAQRWYVPLDEP